MERRFEKRPLRHYSFILSLWTEGGALTNAPPVWRFSLEDPHTAERRGFKDLAELLHYLEEWTQNPTKEAG